MWYRKYIWISICSLRFLVNGVIFNCSFLVLALYFHTTYNTKYCILPLATHYPYPFPSYTFCISRSDCQNRSRINPLYCVFTVQYLHRTVLSPFCVFTILYLHHAVSSVYCIFKVCIFSVLYLHSLYLEHTVSSPYCIFTVLYLHFTVYSQYCIFTVLCLHRTVSSPDCIFTELFLHCTVSLLYCIFTVILLSFHCTVLLNYIIPKLYCTFSLQYTFFNAIFIRAHLSCPPILANSFVLIHFIFQILSRSKV